MLWSLHSPPTIRTPGWASSSCRSASLLSHSCTAQWPARWSAWCVTVSPLAFEPCVIILYVLFTERSSLNLQLLVSSMLGYENDAYRSRRSLGRRHCRPGSCTVLALRGQGAAARRGRGRERPQCVQQQAGVPSVDDACSFWLCLVFLSALEFVSGLLCVVLIDYHPLVRPLHLCCVAYHLARNHP
jgi:hypothetical protein